MSNKKPILIIAAVSVIGIAAVLAACLSKPKSANMKTEAESQGEIPADKSQISGEAEPQYAAETEKPTILDEQKVILDDGSQLDVQLAIGWEEDSETETAVNPAYRTEEQLDSKTTAGTGSSKGSAAGRTSVNRGQGETQESSETAESAAIQETTETAESHGTDESLENSEIRDNSETQGTGESEPETIALPDNFEEYRDMSDLQKAQLIEEFDSIKEFNNWLIALTESKADTGIVMDKDTATIGDDDNN